MLEIIAFILVMCVVIKISKKTAGAGYDYDNDLGD